MVKRLAVRFWKLVRGSDPGAAAIVTLASARPIMPTLCGLKRYPNVILRKTSEFRHAAVDHAPRRGRGSPNV